MGWQYRCAACGGDGFYARDEHNQYCHGDNCGDICPIQVQERCICCMGTGRTDYETLVSIIDGRGGLTPLEKSIIIDQFIVEAEDVLSGEAQRHTV